MHPQPSLITISPQLDAADESRVASARKELHRLLEDPALSHTPLLIAANKIDLTPHMSEQEVIKNLNLDYIMCVVAGDGAACAYFASWPAGRRNSPTHRSTPYPRAPRRCRDQPWVVVPISARYQTNVDGLLQWLLKQKGGGR